VIHRVHIEGFTGQVQHLDFFFQLFVHLCTELIFDDGGVQVSNRFRCPIQSTRSAFEEVHFFLQAIKDTFEFLAGPDRPVDRKGSNAQYAFQFVQQLKGILGRPVAFVHEGEDGDAPAATDLKKLAGLGFNPFGCIDDHDHSIDRCQHPIGVF